MAFCDRGINIRLRYIYNNAGANEDVYNFFWTIDNYPIVREICKYSIFVHGRNTFNLFIYNYFITVKNRNKDQ